jgi:hypothetical protein
VSSGGWFRLHRGWRDNPLFRGEFSRADAWIWLIENACWRPTRFDVRGKIVTLDRGQLSVTLRQLADVWGWSKSSVERFLTRLETETMITQETGQGKSVLTICNYAKYQDVTEAGWDKAGTQTGTKLGQSWDIKEEGKKERREEDNTPLPPAAANDGDDDDEGDDGTGSPPSPPEPPAKPKAKVKPKQTFTLPDWLPLDPWRAFLGMRKKMGKEPTDRAVELLVAKLDRFRANGHDPGQVLDQSTVSNWIDVYEIKEPRNDTGTSRSNERDNRDGFVVALDRRLDELRPGEPSGASGRPDAGDGGRPGELPFAAPPALR